MKLWVKLLGLILGVAVITGVAATIRKSRSVEKNLDSEFVNSAASRPASQPVLANATTNSPDAQTDPHLLRLLTPSDPDFNSRIDTEYPGLKKASGFQDIQSKIVLVQNQSAHAIHAFVMKWTTQTQGGSPEVTFTPYMKTPTPNHVLTGGVVLAPNESRLLSPWFSLSKAQFASMRGGNGSLDVVVTFLRANLAGPAKDSKLLGGSVDGVVFGDRHFVGSDEAKLLDHFECERNGQHDEGISMSRALKNRESDQQIIDRLNAHIQKGQALRGNTDRQSLYLAARASEAQMLLQIFKQGGRNKLEQIVNTIINFRRTVLQP